MTKIKYMLWAGLLLSTISCSVDDSFNLVVIDEEERCGDGSHRVQGEGAVVTRTLQLGDFHSITNLQEVSISISQGVEQEVKATGHANIIDRLHLSVSGGDWTVLLQEGCYGILNLSLEISLPNLRRVNSKAPGNIKIHGFKGLDSLEIISMGSGAITAINDFELLHHLSIDNRGSGDLWLYPLETGKCDILSAGSGDSFVSVRDSLNATLKGSGNISYHGNPVIQSLSSGSGQLIKDN